MRLNRVIIKNYRSIEDICVEFEPTCRVLVGINESGKSNILSALSLLDDKYIPIRKDDLREALPGEEVIKESYVNFVFKFEKNEMEKLHELVFKNIAIKEFDSIIIDDGNKKYSLKRFCDALGEGLFWVDILEGNKSFKRWRLDEKYKLVNKWKKITTLCPSDFSIEINGQKNQLSQYKIIKAADFVDIPESYLQDADINDVATLIGIAIVEITKANHPKTLFWKYDEKNILPNSVNIANFASNPNICVPLKNMFILAGIEDIKASIDDKRKGSDNQFQNYLNGVANKTTNHFRSVWKEYKNIEFSLSLNADQIIPGIKEMNIHDFARRSDGFKRFVTFLLTISVNVKTDNIRNTLLLIDEPENSLHPSGARYLRDELIKISKTNYVVYSTHSIFMIDSNNIDRHYIVRKDKEKTSIESAGNSDIVDEEVIYNALGHSVFAILKEQNIIFEGWNDKKLFQVFLEKAPANLKKKYKEISYIYAKGAKNIKTISSIIDLAHRKCLIISDSDNPATEQKKLFEKNRGYGSWKNYQEINNNIEAITGEDFINNEFILRQIKDAVSCKTFPVLPNKKGKIDAIQKWLIDNGMTIEQAKQKVKEIKNLIFENMVYKDIEDDYKKLVESIIF